MDNVRYTYDIAFSGTTAATGLQGKESEDVNRLKRLKNICLNNSFLKRPDLNIFFLLL